MKVVGLYLVRNEVDILELNLRYHFDTLIDEAIVVDNGSRDGTLELLGRLSTELPLVIASEPGAYTQANLVTRMARQAGRHRADWVVPIDADEFWAGDGRPVRDVLAETSSTVSVLRCEVVNFVQRRDVLAPSPRGLLTAVMRVAQPTGPPERCEELVESGQIGFVEMEYVPKSICRPAPTIMVASGNHGAEGVPGSEEHTDAIACLHVPIRSRSMLTTKIEQGMRVDEAGAPRGEAWHVRRWWRLAREGSVDDEWAACSHADGTLTVRGKARPLVSDARLATALSPLIDKVAVEPTWFLHSMQPEAGAYLLGMDTVPGWFSGVDFRLFAELDLAQRTRLIEGDLLEIGAYFGKTAILLGYLRGNGERLVVCDLFNQAADITDENVEENARWYQGFGRDEFERHYLRFHTELPEIIAAPSTEIDRDGLAGRFRFVHVDGSHQYEVVREDLETARRLLKPGGVVAFDDIFTPHNPGSALAVWEAISERQLKPICITDAKLYGTWDENAESWVDAVSRWAEEQADLDCEVHQLAGSRVLRVYPAPPPSAPDSAPPLVALEPLEAADGMTSTASARRRAQLRHAARLVAPPIAVQAYRRMRGRAGTYH